MKDDFRTNSHWTVQEGSTWHLVELRSMPLGALVGTIVTQFKDRLRQSPGDEHVVEMRVFGSRARGDARPDSDLDLFVMVDTPDPDVRTAIYEAAWDVGYEMELPFAVTPLVMTREHFEDLQRRERLIAREISSEGIVV